MANEEALGPRKTMFVLVVVVGCFAVLWPRILSPLLLGSSRDQLEPNKFDRDAGCCEVLFESEVAFLEIINEVCNSAIQADGKMSPVSAAECRKTVNETCGVDIAAFLKRTNNVGKTTKVLLETMKASNSSCLKEHFGVPVYSLSSHTAFNSWTLQDTLKQERPAVRGAGPHPALRERGRAIPAGTPPPQVRPTPLPPHVRVRSSPLSVYFELDIKPPPIPGMRPPLGAPGGPMPAPKTSMGVIMPIYTISILVFFVYTLSKILFKRTGTVPYDQTESDPQFRRRVFRDDSRSSPDKLVVTAISGLVAEVQQQMEASYAQNQQRQDALDNHARPYTNGTILHSGPVQIVASEYREPLDKSSEPKESTPEPKEPSPEPTPETKEQEPEPKESTPEPKEPTPESKEPTPESKEPTLELKEPTPESSPEEEESPEQEVVANHKLLKSAVEKDSVSNQSADFLREERENQRVLLTPELEVKKEGKQSTSDLLEEALKEDSEEDEDEEEEEEEEEEDQDNEKEKSSVKVIGMELTAHAADGGVWPRAEPPPVTPLPPLRPPHEADKVKSIFLETEIPQQSRVLVADFAEDRADRPQHTDKHSPLVVSGKMTLSLIQDAPRETPERDLESTMDEFTTASAVTQNAAEKEDNLSDDEEVDEEIEVEEIEEEIEEEDEEEEEQKETDAKK